jgi:hypothetical protein
VKLQSTSPLLVVGLVVAAATAPVAAGAEPGRSATSILSSDLAQSTLRQDPTFVAAKMRGRVTRNASGQVVIQDPAASSIENPAASSIQATSTSALLDTYVVSKIVEPEGGTRYDDLHRSYTDSNYWNFCTAGAAEAALAYWTSNPTNWSGGYFTEPYGPHKSTTYWASVDTGTSSDTGNGYGTFGRAYLMYLAEQVLPPSYSRAGIVNFSYYPTHGGSLPDIRDALNWEASGHSGSWSNYFYIVSNPSESQLRADIRMDIDIGAPVVATVNTGYLPNWSRSLGHSITIIGYDDSNGTYQYVDTCGRRCNGASQSTNGGIWSVSMHNMYLGIHSWGTGIAW